MYLIGLDLGQGIWSKVIKWSSLGGKYNEVAQTVNSGAKQLATMQQVAEVYLTLVQSCS